MTLIEVANKDSIPGADTPNVFPHNFGRAKANKELQAAGNHRQIIQLTQARQEIRHQVQR